MVSIQLVSRSQCKRILEASVCKLSELFIHSKVNPNIGVFNTNKRTSNTNRIHTNTSWIDWYLLAYQYIKLEDSPANLIKSTKVLMATPQGQGRRLGTTHPSKSRTWNLWILDQSKPEKPLINMIVWELQWLHSPATTRQKKISWRKATLSTIRDTDLASVQQQRRYLRRVRSKSGYVAHTWFIVELYTSDVLYLATFGNSDPAANSCNILTLSQSCSAGGILIP